MWQTDGIKGTFPEKPFFVFFCYLVFWHGIRAQVLDFWSVRIIFFSWLCGFLFFGALWVPSWWCSLVLGVVCGCSVLALISSAFLDCGFRQFIIFGVWSIMSSNKLEAFPIRFTGKNYSTWEFQFKLFVKGKELWGPIDGSVPAP